MALASAVPFGREPRTSRDAQARGKREKRAAGPTEEQSGTIAEPPLRSFAQRRSDRKKEEQTAQTLGIFFDLSGGFSPMASTASAPHAAERSKSGETGEKALARTREQHQVSVFRLHPSAVIRWFTTHYG